MVYIKKNHFAEYRQFIKFSQYFGVDEYFPDFWWRCDDFIIIFSLITYLLIFTDKINENVKLTISDLSEALESAIRYYQAR